MDEDGQPTFGERLEKYRWQGSSVYKVPKVTEGKRLQRRRCDRQRVGKARERTSVSGGRRAESMAKYAHLPQKVPDTLGYGLVGIFIGLNPGVATAVAGHMFAGATNLFWPLLYQTGCVDEPLSHLDDTRLPRDFSLGITNLISRPTRGSDELARDELVAAVPELELKISQYQPLACCIIGKGVWEAIYRYKTGTTLYTKNALKPFEFGWQPPDLSLGASENFYGSRVFVVPSTSGRAAAYSRQQKFDIWKEWGEFVQQEKLKRKLEQSTTKT